MFDLALPDRKRPERSPHLRLPAEPSGAVLPAGGALEPLRRQSSVISFAVWARLLRDTGFGMGFLFRDTGFCPEKGVSRTAEPGFPGFLFRDTPFLPDFPVSRAENDR